MPISSGHTTEDNAIILDVAEVLYEGSTELSDFGDDTFIIIKGDSGDEIKYIFRIHFSFYK